jgi:hypothetical protein
MCSLHIAISSFSLFVSPCIVADPVTSRLLEVPHDKQLIADGEG